MKKSNPLITPGVHLSGLVDIEGMCWNINYDRGHAIMRFKEAVFLALPDDQAARNGHFNATMLLMIRPDLLYQYAPSTDPIAAVAVAVVANAIMHGVPVATINFLAAIHLSPDLLKE